METLDKPTEEQKHSDRDEGETKLQVQEIQSKPRSVKAADCNGSSDDTETTETTELRKESKTKESRSNFSRRARKTTEQRNDEQL